MTLPIRSTRQFERDFKLIKRRGKNTTKLFRIVETLALARPLDKKLRPHKLTGGWSGSWECHIEPDWLLIWQYRDGAVVLVRTGTHSDLFE